MTKEIRNSEEITKAYARIAQLPDGKLIFEDLKRQFYDKRLSNEPTCMAMEAGARNLMHYILNTRKVSDYV